jgi:hypothetical protein
MNGSVAAGEGIKFSGAAETLALGDPHNFLAKIESFTRSDTIDLTNVPRSAITGHQFAHGVLTLDETAGSLTLTFASPSGFKSDAFVVTGHGAGTTIKLEPSVSQTSRAHRGMAFALLPSQTTQLPLITLQP